MHTSENPITQEIQRHYDLLSPLYQMFWGEHIHHGYWENDESQEAAQENLVRHLAEMARIPERAEVLDIGCGIGGSSVWLARELGCNVVGLTLSSVQVGLARKLAESFQVVERARFDTVDANNADFGSSCFDAVWIVESSEHVVEKREFFARAARSLRPGAVLALCAWVRADPFSSLDQELLVQQVCEGMLCPLLASAGEYVAWMNECGLRVIAQENCTAKVERTWAICTAILNRPEVRSLLEFSPPQVRRFTSTFDAMRRAYAMGAMGYLMVAAESKSEEIR